MKISRAVSRDRAVRSLPLLLFLFQLVRSLSPGVSLFYMRIIWRHLERVTTITGVCLGLLNWIYWGGLFFRSLKDPLMGPNQFRTACVALAWLTRHGLSPGLCVSLVVCLEATGARGSSPARPLTLILWSLIVKVVIPAATLASRKKGEK